MVALYQNDGRGRFRDVTDASGLVRRGWGAGTCIADYDNDGFRDVYVTAFGPDALWRNGGDGNVRGRDAKGGRRRHPVEHRAARSATTTSTATWISTSPNYVRFDESRDPGPRHQRRLPLHGHRRVLRPESPAG